MTFSITLDDFWLDQEEDIEPALKEYIINSVVLSIRKEIDEKVKVQIEKVAKDKVEASLSDRINGEVERLIKEGKVKGQYSNDPEITLEEFILRQFTKASGWGSQQQVIENLAKKFGDEMKQRYDLLFASQVVAKMNKNGFLKEDVAKLLLAE